jgi:hypothetical protein
MRMVIVWFINNPLLCYSVTRIALGVNPLLPIKGDFQNRVEFDGEDADQHILSFVAEAGPRRTGHGKPELPGRCVPKLELGNEVERGGGGLKKIGQPQKHTKG